ncbi:hypothetical protein PGT21_036047 [Puccinia graminis f. sp. tritici]|uniref:Uncharacterized protein n=1 Tax=Puccinia graminis f. sp. tritici TaxID=56615 RepID=A0A5B0QQF0_PUCGR|nr:hypothetical protein PGT21_036047 [Puccinia graminis f. sp. tritici]KAA1123033.1 hypothetical protein PGTUg99_010808 [Puccinia graminis f. sp. tritici]
MSDHQKLLFPSTINNSNQKRDPEIQTPIANIQKEPHHHPFWKSFLRLSYTSQANRSAFQISYSVSGLT